MTFLCLSVNQSWSSIRSLLPLCTESFAPSSLSRKNASHSSTRNPFFSILESGIPFSLTRSFVPAAPTIATSSSRMAMVNLAQEETNNRMILEESKISISVNELEITFDNYRSRRTQSGPGLRRAQVIVLVRTHAQDYRSCADACTRLSFLCERMHEFKRSRASVFSLNNMLEV
jgi:hypothetical protein